MPILLSSNSSPMCAVLLTTRECLAMSNPFICFFGSYIRGVLVTGRNEVLAKVIFSQACVCPQGGCLLQIFGGVPAPNFRGGVPAPKFWGGCLLQNFGGACSKFLGGAGACSKFSGGLQFSEYGQRSAGTHPTGMHSRFAEILTFY